MKKSLLLSFFVLALLQTSFAQVLQTVVVEHFTNTRCGICASRNPGLFNNLAANPKILHIAVHPSSPYSTCLLNQHNKVENDARTNFYGIYGGTPRIVINGTVMNGSFTSSTLFDTFKTQTSPLEVRVSHINYGRDSISATVIIKAVDRHNLGNVQLYVPLVEDSLQYSAPNGESLHHNVFRKVFNNSTFMPPANGDSLILNYTLAGNSAWNFDQLKAMAIIQNSTTKRTIQASESMKMISRTNNISNPELKIASYYPNPAKDGFFIETTEKGSLTLYNSQGKQVLNQGVETSNSYVNIKHTESGIYTAIFTNTKGITQQQKIILL